MSKKLMEDQILTMRGRAFSGEGVREHKVWISGGVVRVWDNVAGHFTTCHKLKAAVLRRVAKAGVE